MEFRDVVEERRSTRKFFPKPIPMEAIGELIAIGSHAPSIGDLQPWNFIICTKAKKIQDVADACPYERWLYQAPLVIVICALEGKAEMYYPGKGRDWAQQSCAAAAQSMLLGAVDLGLSGCWVSSFETIKIKEVLHIPDGIEPCIMLAIGYSDEEPNAKRYAPFHTNTFWNDFAASSTDKAVYMRDYGLFFRDRIEDAKTHAAYATAPRGGVREAAENIQQKIKGLFKKKKKEANGEHNQPNVESHPDHHFDGQNPEDHELDHDHDGHDGKAH